MNYALVLNGEILRREDFGSVTPLVLSSNKGVWLPVVEGVDLPWDPRYQTRSLTLIVESGRVVANWTIGERDLATVQAEQIRILKDRTRASILEYAPDYRQWNAALGLLPPEEIQAVKEAIINRRTACQTTETNILAAQSGMDVVAVMDGLML